MFQVIVKFGIPGESIHLISSGTVAVMNGLGREVNIMYFRFCDLMQLWLNYIIQIGSLATSNIFFMN